MGRPSEFSPEIANEICERLAKGESLRSITSDEQSGWLPSETTVRRWLSGEADWNAEFRRQYAHAREMQADHYAEEIVAIADGRDKPTPQELEEQVASDTVAIRDHNRDRLRIDARKWVASKLAPKKYGEAMNLKHSDPDGGPVQTRTTLDVTGLSEEQLRVLASVPVHRG